MCAHDLTARQTQLPLGKDRTERTRPLLRALYKHMLAIFILLLRMRRNGEAKGVDGISVDGGLCLYFEQVSYILRCLTINALVLIMGNTEQDVHTWIIILNFMLFFIKSRFKNKSILTKPTSKSKKK